MGIDFRRNLAYTSRMAKKSKSMKRFNGRMQEADNPRDPKMTSVEKKLGKILPETTTVAEQPKLSPTTQQWNESGWYTLENFSDNALGDELERLAAKKQGLADGTIPFGDGLRGMKSSKLTKHIHDEINRRAQGKQDE
jgi:hypothetical protein